MKVTPVKCSSDTKEEININQTNDRLGVNETLYIIYFFLI